MFRQQSMQVGHFGFWLGLGLLFFFQAQLFIAFAEHGGGDHEQGHRQYDGGHAAGFVHPEKHPLGFDQADQQNDG